MKEMKLKKLAVKFFCLGILFSSSLTVPLPAEAQSTVPAYRHSCYRHYDQWFCTYSCPAGWWNAGNGTCYRTSSQAPVLDEDASKRLVGLLQDLGMERSGSMVGEVSEQDGKASVAQISEHGLVGGKSVNATAIDRGPESESQQQEKAI